MKFKNLDNGNVLPKFLLTFILLLFLPILSFADWEQVNIDGFGDSSNTHAYSMAVFNGYIYVGTGNESGLEIWRSNSGTSWEMVVGDSLAFPHSSGFADPDNTSATSMIVFDNNLYVATWNASTGCEIWRSSDGVSWVQVNLDGFSSSRNEFILSMEVFNNYLYAGTYKSSGGCEIWRTDGQGSPPLLNWEKTNASGFGTSEDGVYSMKVFNNYLYAGTYHGGSISAKILRTDAQGSLPFEWHVVADDNQARQAVFAMEVLCCDYDCTDLCLYISNRYYHGCEVWSTNGQGDPLVWLKRNINGFGDGSNEYAFSMSNDCTCLYVGTSGSSGSEIWKYYRSSSWTQDNENGFGDSNNTGARRMVNFGNYLYVGTINESSGCEIWRKYVDLSGCDTTTSTTTTMITTTTSIDESTTTTTTDGLTTTTTPGGSTTTTVSKRCPSDYPIDCGNGWCCPLDYPVCGTDPFEGYCFKEDSLKESSDIIILNSGTLNGQSLDLNDPRLTVAPGTSITGTVNITVRNSHGSKTVVPVCATPNWEEWGDRTTIYWTIDSWVPVGDTSYYVNVNLTAPNTEGTYYILFGSSGEIDCGDVMSNTHWSYGDPVWNDENDFVDFDESTIQSANQKGWVEVLKLTSNEYALTRVGARAVKVTVTGVYTTTTTTTPQLILITGTVKNKFNAEPIVGASVTINGNSAITDGEGKYDLYQGPGTWIMNVDAASYVSHTEEVTVDAGDQVVNKDFLIIPLVQVTGAVRDVFTQGPIEGALVAIGGDYDSSDQEGRYELVQAPGDWIIEVTASGYEPLYEMAVVAEGVQNVERDFYIGLSGSLGSIAGTIADLDSKEPIEWAKVSTDGGGITFSDMYGCYRLVQIPGTWTLEVEADNYVTHTEGVTVAEGEEKDRDIDLISMGVTTTTVPDITVDFIGKPTIGMCPLTVVFANLSKGNIASYLWDFGDGETSTEEDPEHTYKKGGIYSVRLVDYGADGGSLRQEVKRRYVLVIPSCPFTNALDNPGDVNTLRYLRDSMLDNIFGLIATHVYYQNSAEITSILVDSPELQDKLRDLVSKNIGVATALINGSGASVPQGNVDEIIDFLHDLKEEGNPKLKADIKFVIDAIRMGYFLCGIGVKVE